MDNNDNGLFGARNENSVLFSLDDLNSMDSDSSGGAGSGFGSSGDASGLINLDMLSKMGGSSGDGDEEDETFSGMGTESRVFNAVVDQKTKRNYYLIAGIGIVVAIVLVVAGVLIYSKTTDDYKKQKDEIAAAAAASQEENEKKARELAELKAQLEQMEKQGETNAAEREKLRAELEKMQDAEMQAKMAADDEEEKKGSSSGSKKSSASASAAKSAGSSAPAKSSGGAGKPDPAKIRSALAAANTKAKKCGKAGNLVLQMSINGSGSAKNIKGIGGSFKGSATEKCIITVVEKHQFPEFSGSAISVKYDFKL